MERCGESHWPVENWLNEGQTATGTIARFTLTSHYTTIQQLRKNNTNKTHLEKGYHNRPTASRPLLSPACLESQAKCMYGKLRYPTLSRVAYWNCTCEVVRGSSLLPALLAAVLAGGGSPLSAGFIIWTMGGFVFHAEPASFREQMLQGHQLVLSLPLVVCQGQWQ